MKQKHIGCPDFNCKCKCQTCSSARKRRSKNRLYVSSKLLKQINKSVVDPLSKLQVQAVIDILT